jgi:hypothetical protein
MYMPDPVTLSIAGVGAIAIKEGIKFLYGQAADILKRWRSRQGGGASHGEERDGTPVHVVLPSVFDGQLCEPWIHFDVVRGREQELRNLYKELAEYATDVEPVEKVDTELLRKVGALRDIVEEIYQQRITFRGEQRPKTGTLLLGRVVARSIAGEATGLEVEGSLDGEARGEVQADQLESGAKVIGTKWKAKS